MAYQGILSIAIRQRDQRQHKGLAEYLRLSLRTLEKQRVIGGGMS